MARPGYIGRILAALLLVGASARAVQPDACTAFTLRNTIERCSTDDVWASLRRMIQVKDADWTASDMVLVHLAACAVHYEVGTADVSGMRSLLAERAASMGVAPDEYLRRALVFVGSAERAESDRSNDMVAGITGFYVYWSGHHQEAEVMARDIWRGLSGEKVDLSGRMGADNRVIELQLDIAPWVQLYMQSFTNLTQKEYGSNPIFAALCDRLGEFQGGRFGLPVVMAVQNPAARDAYARWLYLVWEKYLERPDADLLASRSSSLKFFVGVHRSPIPTVLTISTRDRLGIAPDRWAAFCRFSKDTRSGLNDARFGLSPISGR